MNKKEQLQKKVERQQELVNNAKVAGRSLNQEEQKEFDTLQRDIEVLKTEISEEERIANLNGQKEMAVKAERQRATEITALCRDFDVDPKDYIEKGKTIDQVRAEMLEKARERMKPLSAGDVRIDHEETDKIREAASDAILMRSGKSLEKLADGARDFRGMRLRDLAIDCLVRAGKSNVHRLDDDQLYREALSPDSQFASILSNAVNKSMSIAYKGAQTTYQAWTGKGSNPDFKGATHYQISEAGELLPMTQTGEFKFDEMKDQGVSKAVATFGRKFGLTRQALINDDIGILTRVPESYVRAAGRGINKLVYKMLGSNPAIYDGKNLFHADHKNLGTAGVLSVSTLGELRKLMRTQKNIRGEETLNINPTYLIVPAALETEAQKLLFSIADPSSDNSGVANVFRNSLTLVVDAELDSYSEKSFYTAAASGDVDTIEVTYLNGDDMPKIESRIGFDFLGMEWRIYIDYGVTVLDYRGLGKNAGQ